MSTKTCARCGKHLPATPDTRVYSRFSHSYYCANVDDCAKRARRRKHAEVTA